MITDHQVTADDIRYVNYESEDQMPDIMELMQHDLSEPYTIYTYRYFINNWRKLSFLAYDKTTCVGAIVCKIDVKETPRCTYTSEPIRPPFKGYIGMLDVKKEYRKLKIGTKLVTLAIDAMREMKVDEIVLETEVTNKPALRLYENLGFLKESRHFRYYLNGLDAFRLKLWLKEPEECST